MSRLKGQPLSRSTETANQAIVKTLSFLRDFISEAGNIFVILLLSPPPFETSYLLVMLKTPKS